MKTINVKVGDGYPYFIPKDLESDFESIFKTLEEMTQKIEEQEDEIAALKEEIKTLENGEPAGGAA